MKSRRGSPASNRRVARFEFFPVSQMKKCELLGSHSR
jgi:hypothetical protein